MELGCDLSQIDADMVGMLLANAVSGQHVGAGRLAVMLVVQELEST